MSLPDSDFDDFSVMVDPLQGKISLICPAPIIGFQDIDDYKEFVSMLYGWIPALEGRIVKEGPVIDKSYSKQVLEQWQNQIKDSLSEKPGPKKSGNKQKTSTDKGKQ